MSDGYDGGRWALAGYLYQIVGILGMQAYAHCSDVAPDSPELEALLRLVRIGQLYHEHLDQDAVLRQLGIGSNDDYVLVQFKYSSQVPPRTIGPAELEEIVHRLGQSARQAQDLDRNVVGYTLITNRRFGPEAQDMKDAAESGDPIDSLTSGQYATLQQLRVITDLRLSVWQEALRSFAHELGAEEAEVERGISRLVGDLVRQTAAVSNAPVTESALKSAFTEYERARPLIPESIAEISIPILNCFISRHRLPGEPVRRVLLEEIARASVQRALVVLHGSGGCGKTVALWQWARETATACPPRGRPSTAISAAGEIPRLWITQTVCDWAGLPHVNHSRRAEEPERALQRLCVANPDAPRPILFLGLDGLDEGIDSSEQKHIVRELLRWFWEEDEKARQEGRVPKAALVVTCRSVAEVVSDWLRLDVSGYGYHGVGPSGVEVTDFSKEELLEAARAGPPTLSNRIEAAVRSRAGRPLGTQVYDQEPPLLGESGPYVRGANEEVLEALMHPAVWRALLELDPDVQSRVLSSELPATRQLAAAFVQRFCVKVVVRGRLAGMNEDALLDVLCAIARHSANTGRIRQPMADWIDSACNTGWVPSVEARILWYEALSGGMILQDGRDHWRWRHRLVWDYLAEPDTILDQGPRDL